MRETHGITHGLVAAAEAWATLEVAAAGRDSYPFPRVSRRPTGYSGYERGVSVARRGWSRLTRRL